MTARHGISLPSASVTTWMPCSGRSPVASHGALSRAPRRWAWMAVRDTRSSPEIPLGKPA